MHLSRILRSFCRPWSCVPILPDAAFETGLVRGHVVHSPVREADGTVLSRL